MGEMSARRRVVIDAVEALAAEQHGIVSRAQAATLGADKERVRREVAAGRWAVHGLHTVAIHRAALPERATWRAALFEVGSGAALDGPSALRAAGLDGYDDVTCVSVPHGSQPRRIHGVVVHEVRRWRERDVVGAGVRRTRPHVAAVRAAAWARTDRQAALLLVMTVQQRISTAEAMLAESERYPRLRRRRVIRTVLAEAVLGVQTLGELDFARLCRRRGLPEPSRQVLRRGPRGRVYLDVFWDDLGVVVEIEGMHHLAALHLLEDSLRQNHLSITTGAVLRIPSLGLLLEEQLFMDQVETMLRTRRRRGAA